MSYIKSGAIALSLFTVTAFVWASESDEIRVKARAMQRKAAELAERGRGEEAENLERKAVAMLEEAEHLDRHRPDHPEAGIRERQERLELLRMEERELEEIGGKKERLADVRHEAERIERELRELSHGEHREHDDSHDSIARRLEHMRIAVEHLHHAGLHDIAEHVAERAEATERERHERRRHHEGDVMHEVMEQLDEIRREVGRLRNEVSELREKR